LDGISVPVQVDHNIEINVVDFELSDRAYDPNNVTMLFETASGTVMATGTFSEWGPYGQDGTYPAVQLNQVITLMAGVRYQMVFSSLPSSDTYGGMPGVAEDAIQEAACGDIYNGAPVGSPCVPQANAYLGLSEWPVFSLGLMNLQSMPSGLANFNYGSYTDLEASPGGDSGTNELGMRFQATTNEQLLSFEVMVIGATSSANQLVFTLRSDAGTGGVYGSGGSYPVPLGRAPALATASVTMAQVFANLSTAYPTSTSGSSGFIKVYFPKAPMAPMLLAGTYYWIVMATTNGDRTLTLGRLVNPYRELVLSSNNDFAHYGVPGDGPTDIGFKIVTTHDVINNAIISTPQYEYLNEMAQSFIPVTSTPGVKGVWDWSVKAANEYIYAAIQTDSGHDSPSGTVLAGGVSPQWGYISFNQSVTVTAGVKYWLVYQIGPCLTSSCSAPSEGTIIEYRSDMYNTRYDFGGTAIHAEVNSGSGWATPANLGDMIFQLVTLTGHEGDPIWTTTTTTTSSSPTVTTSTSLTVTTSIGMSTTATVTIRSTFTSTLATSSSSTTPQPKPSSTNWDLLGVAFVFLVLGAFLVVL
jgi:hypothetical protein